MEVLAFKSDFLRGKSFIDDDTAAYFIKYAAFNGDLAPQLIVNTSNDLTRTIADVDTVDADALDDGKEAMDIDGNHGSSSNSYIDVDATYLSEGSAATLHHSVYGLECS
jgi:hypothetical protein